MHTITFTLDKNRSVYDEIEAKCEAAKSRGVIVSYDFIESSPTTITYIINYPNGGRQ